MWTTDSEAMHRSMFALLRSHWPRLDLEQEAQKISLKIKLNLTVGDHPVDAYALHSTLVAFPCLDIVTFTRHSFFTFLQPFTNDWR